MHHAPADDARSGALPRYLYDACALPKAHLNSLLKFRMGSHNLRRVVGAYTREPRDTRVCRMPGCGGSHVEDELHIVFECPAFAPQRTAATDDGLVFSDDHNLSAFLSQDPALVAKFIHNCTKQHECFVSPRNP
jgi:hypothetical protein